MIRYSLKCSTGHRFESWFQNAAAFLTLRNTRKLTCAVCGDAAVEKDLMAPGVQSGPSTAIAPAATAKATSRPDLSLPDSEIEKAIAAWRRHVESNSEYVGVQFAREVRRIHEGEAPERLIHGEARPDEARQLIEDGLPVSPLPFLSPRKVN